MSKQSYDTSVMLHRMMRLVAEHGAPNSFSARELCSSIMSPTERMWVGRFLSNQKTCDTINAELTRRHEEFRISYAKGVLTVKVNP